MPIQYLPPLLQVPARAGRGLWWLGVAIAAAVVSGALALGGDHNALLMVGAALVSLAILIPISIARLHDRNHSGTSAFNCLLLAGVVAKMIRHTVDADFRWWAIAALGAGLAIWAIVELGFLRGTVGRNPYGPDPLDETATERPEASA